MGHQEPGIPMMTSTGGKSTPFDPLPQPPKRDEGDTDHRAKAARAHLEGAAAAAAALRSSSPEPIMGRADSINQDTASRRHMSSGEPSSSPGGEQEEKGRFKFEQEETSSLPLPPAQQQQQRQQQQQQVVSLRTEELKRQSLLVEEPPGEVGGDRQNGIEQETAPRMTSMEEASPAAEAEPSGSAWEGEGYSPGEDERLRFISVREVAVVAVPLSSSPDGHHYVELAAADDDSPPEGMSGGVGGESVVVGRSGGGVLLGLVYAALALFLAAVAPVWWLLTAALASMPPGAFYNAMLAIVLVIVLQGLLSPLVLACAAYRLLSKMQTRRVRRRGCALPWLYGVTVAVTVCAFLGVGRFHCRRCNCCQSSFVTLGRT